MHDTSLEAYRQVQAGRGPSLRCQVLEYIRDHPGCISPHIIVRYGESGRKRIVELLGPNIGDVMEGEKIQVDKLWYTTYWIRRFK